MSENIKIIFEPAILLIISIFLTFLTIFILNILNVKKNINKLVALLRLYKKSDLVYRFKELDEALLNNEFICNYWIEFKSTLVFTENLVLKNDNGDLLFNTSASKTPEVYCTVDAAYVFCEDNIINNKINYSFLSAIPTILTALGPLFTFLNIGIGFSKVDFSNPDATIVSVTYLMASMKIAALVSVIAVGSAICFIITERILYNNFCRKPLRLLQIEVNKLFENISPEKFLVELLRESKLQNNSMNSIIKDLPIHMKDAFDQSISSKLLPYLDNLIYSMNKLHETKQPKNVIDSLFESKE